MRIRNKILQMMYRPGKGDIFSSKSFKSFEDMNKLLEDEVPRLGRKRSKSGDVKTASADESKEADGDTR